jgi:hypothetical protein
MKDSTKTDIEWEANYEDLRIEVLEKQTTKLTQNKASKNNKENN